MVPVLAALVSVLLTVESVTPTLGRSPGEACTVTPTRAVTDSTVRVHVRLEAGVSTVWSDSVGTKPGAAWSMTKPTPPAGTYTLRHWYSVAGASGCEWVQGLTVLPCAPAPGASATVR